MKNLKYNFKKNRSMLKAFSLTMFFTILLNLNASAESSLNVKELLQNSFVSYTIMGVGFIVVIVFAVMTSFKGKENEKAKAIHNHDEKAKSNSTSVRRGAPIHK